jgi:hypothetical protein
MSCEKVISNTVYKGHYAAYAGDTWDSFILTWENPDGTIYDFTGATAVCEIKSRKEDVTPLLTLTENNGVLLGKLSHNMKIILTPAQTTSLGRGNYVFIMRITQNSVIHTFVDCTLKLE